MRLLVLFALAALGCPALALAQVQDMPGMDHGQAGGMSCMPDMDMGATAMARMTGALGPYPMTRDSSGTAWQPDSSPMEGLHGMAVGWFTMLSGYASFIYDDQGGPRGAGKTFSESMLMGMAQRETGGGTLTLRGMISLDPLMGKSGYPLLLQTGETANGRTALVDRQHPHDFLMELAGAYSHPIGDHASAFLYIGMPGEPALGPTTYMHRFSGEANPEAPIGHHWLDATHVTFGVATAGLVYRNVKLEISSFTGREPDQHRWDFDRPRFDSWSVRLTWNPAPDWSFQVSHGHIRSPEQLQPEVDQDRTTASASYDRRLAHGNWQTTFAWGRDRNRPGNSTDAYLLESAASFGGHTVFGRAENVGKDELFANQPASPFYGRVFNVSKFSVGYFYTAPLRGHLALDLGGVASKYGLPSALAPVYGTDPTGVMLFARFKLD